MPIDRRAFLKNTTALSAIGALPSSLLAMPTTDVGKRTRFLFQGDSITDGNRSRNTDWNHVMGHGYAYLVASRLWYDFPQKEFSFFNRGISGNKVVDLASRWQEDTLDLAPGVLSILVGINDVDALLHGTPGFTATDYETGYRDLLTRTKAALPKLQLVLCEPFVLPVGRVKDDWENFNREVQLRSTIVARLAQEYGAIFIPFQSAFNEALKRAPADYWIWDGIHPMPAGHELMARQWIKLVGKKLPFILPA